MSEKEKKLEDLHTALTDVLLQKVTGDDVKASDLNVARQFLKDNGIEGLPVDNSNLRQLVDELPYSLDEEMDREEDAEIQTSSSRT